MWDQRGVLMMASWIARLEEATTFEELEAVIQEITNELLEEAGARPQAKPPTQEQRLRHLYRVNQEKAMEEVLGEPCSRCQIPGEELHRYFTHIFSKKEDCCAHPRPKDLPPLPRVTRAFQEGDFTPQEVKERLRRARLKKGSDGLHPGLLNQRDPGCHLRAAIFNGCKRFGRIPSAWKRSRTILFFKSGDPGDPSSWRPISLCSTLYKMYARCIAGRITKWAEEGRAISWNQKAFLPHTSCKEPVFLLQSVLDIVQRRQRQECAVAKLDLTNAFGSIMHGCLFDTLSEFGMPEEFLSLVRELYAGSIITIDTTDEQTPEIEIQSGLKQGCPLSPILFNLAMEPLIRYVTSVQGGFRLSGQEISVLAYADDLLFIAKNPQALQHMLDAATKAANWMGLCFNAAKCKSLHIGKASQNRVLDTKFTIQGETMASLAEGETFQYLGTPFAFPPQQSSKAIVAIVQDAEKIGRSLLTLKQKVDAYHTSQVSKITPLPRGLSVRRDRPNHTDNKILGKLNPSLNQDIPRNRGDVGVLNLKDLDDIAAIILVFHMLNCLDVPVRTIASIPVSWALPKDPYLMVAYLNNELAGGNFAFHWTRARDATWHIGYKWTYNGTAFGMETKKGKPFSPCLANLKHAFLERQAN